MNPKFPEMDPRYLPRKPEEKRNRKRRASPSLLEGMKTRGDFKVKSVKHPRFEKSDEDIQIVTISSEDEAQLSNEDNNSEESVSMLYHGQFGRGPKSMPNKAKGSNIKIHSVPEVIDVESSESECEVIGDLKTTGPERLSESALEIEFIPANPRFEIYKQVLLANSDDDSEDEDDEETPFNPDFEKFAIGMAEMIFEDEPELTGRLGEVFEVFKTRRIY